MRFLQTIQLAKSVGTTFRPLLAFLCTRIGLKCTNFDPRTILETFEKMSFFRDFSSFSPGLELWSLWPVGCVSQVRSLLQSKPIGEVFAPRLHLSWPVRVLVWALNAPISIPEHLWKLLKKCHFFDIFRGFGRVWRFGDFCRWVAPATCVRFLQTIQLAKSVRATFRPLLDLLCTRMGLKCTDFDPRSLLETF